MSGPALGSPVFKLVWKFDKKPLPQVHSPVDNANKESKLPSFDSIEEDHNYDAPNSQSLGDETSIDPTTENPAKPQAKQQKKGEHKQVGTGKKKESPIVFCEMCGKSMKKKHLKGHQATHKKALLKEAEKEKIVQPNDKGPHVSIVDENDPDKILVMESAIKTPCPLCHSDYFTPGKPKLIRRHLKRFHFKHSFTCDGKIFLICKQRCIDIAGQEKIGHYHCVCGKYLNRLGTAKDHVQKCMKDNSWEIRIVDGEPTGPAERQPLEIKPQDCSKRFIYIKCCICAKMIKGKKSIRKHFKTHFRVDEMPDLSSAFVNEEGVYVVPGFSNLDPQDPSQSTSNNDTPLEISFSDQTNSQSTLNSPPLKGRQSAAQFTSQEVAVNSDMAVDSTEGPKLAAASKMLIDTDTRILYSKRHVFVKNPQKACYQCPDCGYKTTKHGLYRHRISVHPSLQHPCSVCSKPFGSLSLMRQHRLSHFDLEGNLTERALRIWPKVNPGAEPVHLREVEKDYTLKEEAVKLLKEIQAEREQEGTKAPTVASIPHSMALQTSAEGDEGGGASGDAEMDEMQDETTDKPVGLTTADEKSGEMQEKRKVVLAQGHVILPRDTDTTICELCGKEVLLMNYNGHMKFHQNDWNCEICNFKCDGKISLEKHKQTEHGVGFYQCTKCPLKFKSKSALKIHLLHIHNRAAVEVDCNICNKTFTNQINLNVHIKRIHQNIKRYFCDFCGKGFYEKLGLTCHRVVHGTAEDKDSIKKWPCSHCKLFFRTKWQAIEHESGHTGEMPFKCSFCFQQFAKFGHFRKHERTVHSEGKHLCCDICGQGFSIASDLNRHVKLHNRGTNKYHCQVCFRKFSTASKLQTHCCAARAPTTPKSQETPTKLRETPSLAAASTASPLVSPKKASPPGIRYLCGYCNQIYSSMDDVTIHISQQHESQTAVLGMAENEMENAHEEVETHELEAHETVTQEQLVAHETMIIDQESYMILQQGDDDTGQETVITTMAYTF